MNVKRRVNDTRSRVVSEFPNAEGPIGGDRRMTEGRISNKQSALVWVILGIGVVALLYYVVLPLLLASLS